MHSTFIERLFQPTIYNGRHDVKNAFLVLKDLQSSWGDRHGHPLPQLYVDISVVVMQRMY